jgi:iron complex outermembrane receptor protein
LALTAGLRHDDYSYAGTATTPRLALIAAPNRNSVVKLLWGTAFRAPNIYEQFVVTAQQSRPSLDPETIESWELTGERRLGGDLLAQASIYHYAVEQLIDLQEDPEGGSNWFANLGRVHTLGGEVGLVYRAERTQGALSYGHAAASDAESGDRLSNSPRHVAKGSATFRLPADFAVTWTQRFESGRLTVYGTRTEAYSVGSLTVRKVELIGGASVLAQVRNLFDTVYATPGGFEHRQARIPQDGRALVLRVDWAF